jgi:hypothetical protein
MHPDGSFLLIYWKVTVFAAFFFFPLLVHDGGGFLKAIAFDAK